MTSQDAAQRRAAWVWPGIVVSLILGSVVICAVTAVLAVSDPSKAIEKDYYDKAVNWESTAIRQATSDRLGWQVAAQVGAPEGPLAERTLRVQLRSAGGTPIDGQQLRATLFHHARAAERTTLDLGALPDEPGIYEATFRNARPGLWRVELEGQQSPFIHAIDVFSTDTYARG